MKDKIVMRKRRPIWRLILLPTIALVMVSSTILPQASFASTQASVAIGNLQDSTKDINQTISTTEVLIAPSNAPNLNILGQPPPSAHGLFPGELFPVGVHPKSIALGDLNGDDALDAVTANGGDDSISVLLGKDDYSFTPQSSYDVGHGPRYVALADLDGDLVLDAVVANEYDNSISVLLGSGNGTFTTQFSYQVGSPFQTNHILSSTPSPLRHAPCGDIERLRQAGLTPKVTHGLPEQAVEALRSKMGLPKDADVDATRLVQLLGELAYFASTLDQVVWSTWHHLAARSTIRRRAPVRASAGRFVAGDEDTSRSQVADGLELLRQITASLVSAVSKCGELFGGPHLARFSPDAIERLVRIEGTSWIKAKEVQYWEKYRQLFAELSVASIQKEIEDVISKYVEDVMKGLGRRTS